VALEREAHVRASRVILARRRRAVIRRVCATRVSPALGAGEARWTRALLDVHSEHFARLARAPVFARLCSSARRAVIQRCAAVVATILALARA